MNTILHITERQKWQQAKIFKSYRCSTLNSQGFIHCSQAAQVIKVANKLFYNQHNLVLLFIKTEQVQAEIRYEVAEKNELFPHIYGALNIDAVYKIIDFLPREDGFFDLPLAVVNLK
ncbi:DUF952 domain-containing protein [Anabaena cylindrica UHCC 0172]|uniref:DUF952 domain-containing protein n=1 Tax=Anabaena cylindrica TaxID=1165 RepID=UPI002B1FE63E|nr:DUF952 domain-containing protein [Anabaena cylindrica]MEA5550289.1 DUF952 domain-containing protein [Anabaena cylindrica UHCC 0172]